MLLEGISSVGTSGTLGVDGAASSCSERGGMDFFSIVSVGAIIHSSKVVVGNNPDTSVEVEVTREISI